MTKLFETGEPQDITAVLESKDARVAFQKKLVTDYPDDSILAVKLNIPGPIKNNDQLHRGVQSRLIKSDPIASGDQCRCKISGSVG